MSENSEHLKQLFASLGLNEDHLLLEDQIKKADNTSDNVFYNTKEELVPEEEWCDSLTSEDYDAMSAFGTTPPRSERNRKQRERNEYCSRAIEAAKTFQTRNRHKSASRCASLPGSQAAVPISFSNSGSSRNHSQNSLRQRKRSQDLQRSYERQQKMQIEDAPMDVITTDVDNIIPNNGSRSESLPPVCFGMKVLQSARYLSVSSRRVGSARQKAPRKSSTSDMPPDRVAFHALMSGLLTSSPQDQNIQCMPRSEEDVLYQQEINELLWLELQAWHAEQDTVSYDSQLLENRQRVKEVYDEVMQFNFQQTYQFTKPDKRLLTHRYTATPSDNLSLPNLGIYDACLGCLSIWCDQCRDKETAALENVWQLLERVDQIQMLFPSSRKLNHFFPSWNEKSFMSRYKALCLWYNTTSQLRFTTDLLGRRLGYMSYDSIPWPNFSNTKAVVTKSPATSVISRDSGHISVDDAVHIHTEHHTPVVRFEIEDSDEGLTSSEPGQSYESDMTSGSSGSLNLAPKGSPIMEGEEDGKFGDQLYPPNVLGGLRRSSSDIFLQANPYRNYVENLLRNRGMKKTLDKVDEVIGDIMNRTICIIEESRRLANEKVTESQAKSDSRLLVPSLQALQEELHQVEGWTDKFDSLGLPRFHTLFLFLASIPMYMMRECLKLRLEQMPIKPSQLSIKQLMQEYKEGIRFAVRVRQKYVKWCYLIQCDLPSSLSAKLEYRQNQAIEELDCNVKKMLEVYLEWLDQFMLMLHRQPNQAGLQRTFLQEEWCFVQKTCPYVTAVESLAASKFCNIACHMLCSVADFFDTGLDDISSSQHLPLEEEKQFLDDIEVLIEDEQDIRKRKLVQLCRNIQDLLSESRERTLRAVALAKMLRKDLEVGFEGYVTCLKDLFAILQDTGHVLVRGHNVHERYVFVPSHLENSFEEILSLFQIQFGASVASDSSDSAPHDYLILISSKDTNLGEWSGPTADLGLSLDCGTTLSKIQVTGFLVVANSSTNINSLRCHLVESFGEIARFSADNMSPDDSVTQSLMDMKNEALDMCKALETSITNAQRLVSTEHLATAVGEESRQQLSHLVRDTVHEGYIFGFEYHKEVVRLINGKQKSTLAPLLSKFARSWIMFVKNYYSPGRGSRPRWAVPGLEFLAFVCDPHITSIINDAEFKKLRLDVENGREYIIGNFSNSGSSTPSTPGGLGSKPFRSQILKFGQRSIDRSHDESDSALNESPIERVRSAIKELEVQIEEQRVNEKLIGRVSEYSRDHIEILPHSVSFSWQRGFKIGTGRFAKVYTAVNNSSGELLAMKVLPLHPTDHRTIKKVTSELDTFEKIRHPNLVKYYGVEIHKDEMLIFMEYCDEGTLEALASSTEGLPEQIVRKYTGQLMSAVHKLHESSIVHRDIKGANIFLAKENNILKLGDFGCAVRLRGHQTEVGELSGIVGTHAFMAPEIFGSNEGHGRAADIWSVGCVVIEMVTGKRPWPQYDSSVQIMFQVGSGKSPAVPESLSEEGQDFLNLCFIHNPTERASAAKLLDHTFVKVEDDEPSPIPSISAVPSPLKGYAFFR